jgi:hypothetical protein
MTENCKFRRAILSAFYNISQRNFGILLILWCSFNLWWNFCLDQNFSYKGKGPYNVDISRDQLELICIQQTKDKIYRGNFISTIMTTTFATKLNPLQSNLGIITWSEILQIKDWLKFASNQWAHLMTWYTSLTTIILTSVRTAPLLWHSARETKPLEWSTRQKISKLSTVKPQTLN